MATLTILVNGRQYSLACDDGQEEHLRRLADEVDERARSLTSRMNGQATEVMGLLLASLTLADELIETKRKTIPKEVYNEDAVAQTINEIAARIENIADSLEIR